MIRGLVFLLTVLFCCPVFAGNLKVFEPKLGGALNFDELEKGAVVVEKVMDPKIGYEKLTEREKKIWDIYEMQSPFSTITEGDGWYDLGGPEKVSVTSHLKSGKKSSYEAKMAHDFELKTAWVEGKKGNGIGESLIFTFKGSSPRVGGVSIYNGYQKSQKVWEDNGRVKKLKLYIDDKEFAILNLKDITGKQAFDFPDPLWEHPHKGKVVLKFEILEVYPGKKYKDTAISELNFWGLDVY